MAAAVFLLLLFGLCAGRSRPEPPPPPRLPPPPPDPGPDPEITDMIDPMSGTAEWPQVVPRGVPRFPGPAWEFYDPPPAAVVARARALLSLLWGRGEGRWRIERTGAVWVAYRAEIVRSGKRGVVVYRPKTAPSSTTRAPSSTSTTAPAQPGMTVLKLGMGLKPAAPVHAVALVQQELGVTPADGRFGPQTKAAVVRYQRARGLTPDGIVGPKTWEALLQRRV